MRIFNEDNTSMMKHLIHPVIRPINKTTLGDYLPKEINVPQWFIDLIYRTKCIICTFFEIVKSIKSMKKLDALRLKKYYSYYIKMKRKKSAEDIRKNSMSILDQMSDDHFICASNSYYKEHIEKDETMLVDKKP